jgi:hypothetical protein
VLVFDGATKDSTIFLKNSVNFQNEYRATRNKLTKTWVKDDEEVNNFE